VATRFAATQALGSFGPPAVPFTRSGQEAFGSICWTLQDAVQVHFPESVFGRPVGHVLGLAVGLAVGFAFGGFFRLAGKLYGKEEGWEKVGTTTFCHHQIPKPIPTPTATGTSGAGIATNPLGSTSIVGLPPTYP
jgi:hypothetical protein